MRQVTSPWMLSHFIGWCVKMSFLRDIKYAMVSSLLFELCELSLQFVIPEFKECWWDSIFIDFLGTNTLGIIAGHFFIKYLNSRSVSVRVAFFSHCSLLGWTKMWTSMPHLPFDGWSVHWTGSFPSPGQNTVGSFSQLQIGFLLFAC
jgi:hypothetical protein